MPGVGTLIDMSGIIAGGATALAFGRLFSEQMKNMMMTVCGISVFVIGITGIMQGMLSVSNGTVSVNGSIPLLISMAAGAIIGEVLGIERRIESLGGLMQRLSVCLSACWDSAGKPDAACLSGESAAYRRSTVFTDDHGIHHDPVPGNQPDLEQGNQSREHAANGSDRCHSILCSRIDVKITPIIFMGVLVQYG